MFSSIISKFSRNTEAHNHKQQNTSNQNSQNTSQLLGIITSIIPEFISITISNLAFWFIPQAVDTNIDNSTSRYILSLVSIPWPSITLITINLLTTAAFIVLYYFEIRREIWLIGHFDYSRRYHSMHLTRYQRDYPDIFSSLGIHNRQYYMVYRIVRIILLANIIVSACIIIAMDALATGSIDYKTITSMITNFWLAYSKVARGLGIAQESLNGNLGIAYFNIQNLSFNRIDPHFKRHISNSNAGIGTASPSRIASRRGSYQPSSSSNSVTPPDSLNNSLTGGFSIQMQLQMVEETNRPIVPVIHIQETDFMEEEKNI
jgi:hypothetical protein